MEYFSGADRLIAAVGLLESGSCSRKSLAKELGISLSSAGKTVGTLVSLGIVGEYLKKNETPGRRTGILKLRSDPVFAVLCITHEKILTNYYGYSLKICSYETAAIDDYLFIDDIFTSYFSRLAQRNPSLRGVCLVCRGEDKDGVFRGSRILGLDGLPLKNMAEELLPGVSISLENRDSWEPDTSSGVSAVICEEFGYVCATIIHDGVPVHGMRGLAGNAGEISDISGRSFSSRIKFAHGADEYAAAIAELFSIIIRLTDPHRILFYSDRYGSAGEILKSVREKLMINHGFYYSDLPKLIARKPEEAAPTALRRNFRNNCILRLLSEK